MWGAIIGDIVGSLYEFDNYRKKDFPFFSLKSRVTDDSLMTIAVADALVKAGKKDDEALAAQAVRSMQSIAKKYPGAGYGISFFDWLFEDDPQPYGSWGNGAAMRISPVGEYARSEEEVKRLSRIVTSVSHNHPEGLKGAECTAMCVYLGRTGATKEEIFRRAKRYYPELGSDTCEKLSETNQFDESCQGTVPQALTCFFEGQDFEDTIRNAIFIGGDSDTIGAIAGGVAEAFFGIPQNLIDDATLYLDDDLLRLVEDLNVQLKNNR